MKCSIERLDRIEHDPVSAALGEIQDWFIYGHLTFGLPLQRSEKDRVNKFHLLIRDAARRFTGSRDLDGLGWFLRQEGNGSDYLFHFHFGLTQENTKAPASRICEVLRGQWRKIAGTRCVIEPWLPGEQGILYLTKLPAYPVPESNYFQGSPCHWRMSNVLRTRLTNSAPSAHFFQKGSISK